MMILDGKNTSIEKLAILKEKIVKLKRKPGLAIIQIGNDKASQIYVNKKKKIAQELNYNCHTINIDKKISEENIIKEINKLNNDNKIDGIIIELPLPKNLNRDKIINSIKKEKDIDGLTEENRKDLINNKPYLIPCTPLAILDLLKHYKISIDNKEITIIGKSILVGTPLYNILKNKNIQVNLLDSKTNNITYYTKKSDIIIIAIGKKHFLKSNMIKKDAIIIDVGINSENGKIYGDADFNNIKDKCSYITPVPGGIGPMTIYEAMNNTYIAYKRKEEKNMEKSKVYFTKKITAESLINIYEKLGVKLTGKVGVKVSTGEDGAKGYLKKELIAPLVKKLNGTILECNTAYPGARNDAKEHMKVAEKHGFTSFAAVDIMDEVGEFKIPVHKGKHLKYDLIGENFKNYDSILNLAHGKGHAMGGFGANLKNQSIGIASRNGKAYIHSCGHTEDPDLCWSDKHEQIDFIESMAEAATAVSDYLKENNKKIVYITVANAISVDCDCDCNQGDPVMEDIGIFASIDPVANDQAFIDAIWNSKDTGKEKMQERIDTRQGRHITEYAESLGLGSTDYELISID